MAQQSNGDEAQTTSALSIQEELAGDLKRALWGGLIAATVSLLGTWVTGRISGMEALAILEAMLPTTRFLASGVMTASATILALMLTLLALSHSSNRRLKSIHYQRVREIAWLDSIAFIAGTVFLLLLNVPLGGAENVPSSAFQTIYYLVLIISSILGGLLISVVLMLYNTIRKLIQLIDPETRDPELAVTEHESQ